MKRRVSALALGLLVSGITIFALYRAKHNQTQPVDPLRLTFSPRVDSANGA